MNKFMQIFVKKTLRFLLVIFVLILIFEYGLRQRDTKPHKFVTYKFTYENRIEIGDTPVKYVFENITDARKSSQAKLVLIDDISYFIQNRLVSLNQQIGHSHNKDNIETKSSESDQLCPYIPHDLCKYFTNNFMVIIKLNFKFSQT
jgi:hypothetical protein